MEILWETDKLRKSCSNVEKKTKIFWNNPHILIADFEKLCGVVSNTFLKITYYQFWRDFLWFEVTKKHALQFKSMNTSAIRLLPPLHLWVIFRKQQKQHLATFCNFWCVRLRISLVLNLSTLDVCLLVFELEGKILTLSRVSITKTTFLKRSTIQK